MNPKTGTQRRPDRQRSLDAGAPAAFGAGSFLLTRRRVTD